MQLLQSAKTSAKYGFRLGFTFGVLAALLLLGTPITAQTRPTATLPPTNTPRATRTPIIQTPTTQTAGQAQTSTATPATIIVPESAIQARVCFGCNRVRLRATAGTSGEVVLFLDPSVPLTVIGRDADGTWVQVVAYTETVGWVATELVVTIDNTPLTPAVLETLPITGQAVNASPTPTSSVGIPSFISNVTANARRIYQNGLALGNRSGVFSKVGDSITASAYFLYPIGIGQFSPGAYGSLAGVAAQYRESMTRSSIAAAPGWTAVQLLTPGSPCGADVTPVACEYQTFKPAFALIMIGTNDSGSGSAGVFAEQLRQIVQITIDNGVVPVLSTIPPKRFDNFQSQQVDAFNRVIRQVAVQFDVPLWDYYAQMVDLPNGGMDADGLHPSVPPDGATGVFSAENLQYGYTVRNLGALYVLDVIQRLVLN